MPLEEFVFKEWDCNYGGGGNENFARLQPTTDGGHILVGLSDSGASGNKSMASFGSVDFWVVKLDANGDILWQRAFGGSDTDAARDVQQTSDGGFIVGVRPYLEFRAIRPPRISAILISGS